ncbi:MAG: hypothetical protein PUA93_02610 [Eubacteriales bacterium]|nr:hypothetical protein [Eubacteriales bacterium]
MGKEKNGLRFSKAVEKKKQPIDSWARQDKSGKSVSFLIERRNRLRQKGEKNFFLSLEAIPEGCTF